MSVPLSDLVNRVRQELGDNPWSDFLTTQVLSTDTSAAVNQPTQWAEGDILEFADDTGEECRVLATPTVNPVSIQRAFNSSYDVKHANGVYVLKNAAFGYNEVVLAINRTLHRMWPWAWTRRTLTITPTPNTTYYYNLPADFIDLISVVQPLNSTPKEYFRYGAQGSAKSAVVLDGLPEIDSGGKSLWFKDFFEDPNNVITVAYRAQMDLGDVEEGLAADAVVMGTAERMLARKQSQRSGQDVRLAEPGMPTIYLQDVQYYKQQFEDTLRRLYIQLLETIPPMRKWAG